MGSPLSAVMASLFMETLESDRYKDISGRRSAWLCYTDNILLITPGRVDLDDILRKVSGVHPKIQFTTEEEDEQQLPFLNTVVIRTNNDPRYKVYRKPTNKDDFVHY